LHQPSSSTISHRRHRFGTIPGWRKQQFMLAELLMSEDGGDVSPKKLEKVN